MSLGSFRTPVIAAVVTLMITPHGTAQAPADSKTAKPRDTSSGQASGREAASGMASGRKSGSVVAADFNHRDAHQDQPGNASGRQDQFPKASGAVAGQPQPQSNARNSAHATESITESGKAVNNKLANAQSNPLYKDNGMSGENPLYESKDKTAYKDGEDPVTRTRPGNNKTNK